MAQQPATQRCENCRYMIDNTEWPEGTPQAVVDESIFGRALSCRRYPPVPLRMREEDSNPYEHHSGYADTYNTSWCGDWAPANPQTVTDGAATLARLVLLGDLTAARALADALKED